MKLRSLASVVAAILSLSGAARAADGSWAVDAGGNWSLAGNWLGGGVATGTDATAWFTNTLTAAQTVTNDYAGPLTIGNLAFGPGVNGFTIAGGTLNLSDSATLPLISVAGSAAVNSSLAGTPGVVKAGAGTLSLGGTNGYAGPTIVSNGTLKLVGGSIPAPPGYVAYYSFDSVAGLVVNNAGSGGAAYNGNLSAATVVGGGRSGNAMGLAISSTQAMTLATSVPVASGQWTLAAWFNGLYTSGSGNGWSTLFQSGNLADHLIIEQQSNARLGSYSGGLGDSGYAMYGVTSGWHHVITVASNGTVNFYVDGAYVGQTAKNITSTISTVGNARNAGYTQPWAQKVDDVYIYTNAIPASLVAQLFQSGGGNYILPTNTALSIAGGAAVDLNGCYQIVGALSDAGGGGGAVANSSNVVAGLTLALDNGDASFSGVIGAGISLVKTGSGTQTLSGANSHAGTTVSAGTLSVAADGNLGATNATVTLAGGTLRVTGTFTNGTAGGRLLGVPVASAIEVAGGQTYGLLNGFVAGSAGGLTKTGDGTLVFNQTSGNNNFTGPLTINGGTVVAQGSVGDGTIRNHVVVNNGGTLRLVSANAIINTCVLTMNAGGTFDMGGSGGDTIAFYAGAGAVTNQNTGMTLSLGNFTNDFSGSIAGSGSLIVNNGNGGAGVQILSGTNTLSGAVTLQGGVLSVSRNENLGGPAAKLNFNGGTLRVTGTALTHLDARSVVWTNFNGSLDISDAANVFTITNVLSGPGTFAKLGAGTVVLGGASLFTGTATAAAGVLGLAPGGSLASRLVTVLPGAQLTLETSAGLDDAAALGLASAPPNFGRVYLTNGVAETVNLLLFDGSAQQVGTWGATGSGATFINDSYFAGPGVLIVTNGFSGAVGDGSWATNAGGAWGIAANWSGGLIAYGTNSTAWFTNALTADRVVTNGYAPLDIGHLVFGSSNFNWTVTNSTLNLAVSAGVPTITVHSNRATLLSVVGGTAGLVKQGGATLALGASNTYSGDAVVNAGALNLQHGGALANGQATVNSDARLELSGNITVEGKTATLYGHGGNFFGALQTLTGTNTWTGPVVLGDANTRIGIGSAGALVVNGAITDNGSNRALTVRGQSSAGSTVVLNGTNSYGRNTEIFGVTLRNGASDRINPAGSLSNRAVAAAFDLAGHQQTLNGIGVANDGAGFLMITNSSTTAASTLTITNAASDHFQAGVIAATVTVVKAGGGTQSFGPVNAFPSVPVQVNGGNLVVSGGVFNGAVSVAAGATLTAVSGPGLVGEYYNASPADANFNHPLALSAHLATLNPALLFNHPQGGATNFDFASNGIYFPPPYNAGAANFEARWRGRFNAPASGTYLFALASDDRSSLWIDGAQVVNKPSGGIAGITNTVALASGLHDIEISFYQGTSSYGLYADVALPGGTTNRLSNGSLLTGPAVGSLSGAAGSLIALSNATLLVSQTNHTSFDGTIGGVGAIRKLGQGTLTLSGVNAHTNSVLGGGRLSVSSDANLGGGVTFDGGLLQVTGTTLTNLDAHPVNWTSFVGGFDIADAANHFIVTNQVLAPVGSASLWKFGPGRLSMLNNTVVASNGFNVRGGTLAFHGGSYSNSANIGDFVGDQAGDSATLVLQGAARFSKVQNWIYVGNSAGATGSVLITDSAVYSNNVNSLSIGQGGSGSLTVQGNAQIATPSGALYVGNNAGSVGTMTLKDNARLTILSGNYLTIGNNAGSRGTLHFQDNALYTNSVGGLYVGNTGTGVLFQTGGTIAVSNRVGIGINAGSAGALHQGGGNISSMNEIHAGGNNAAAYGYYAMSGGSLTNNGWIQVPQQGLGVFYQSGGRITPRANGIVFNNGTGVLYQTGGVISGPQPIYLNWAANMRGELTLAGGTVAITNDLRLNQAANGTNLVNLNGGVLQVNHILKNAAGGVSVVSFNGATVRAGANNTVFMGAGAGGTVGAVDAAYVGPNGAIFDTQTNGVTVAQPLLAPPGNGIASVALTNGGSGYIGAPYVQVNGGGGTGATVVAQIDVALGAVTNLVLTSPGVNYASLPVLAFHGGAGKGAGAVVGALGANASGGLTKLGNGTLALTGTNTYGGVTTVSNGMLLVGSTNAIPGLITLATNTAGVGPTYPLDQGFINWLTSRLTGGVSPGILVIGTNTAMPIDLTSLPNTSLGAAYGTWTYSGNLTLPGTNLYLGNASGTLIYAPNLGNGTNVFIGYNGANTFPPIGAVQLSGTNGGYAGTLHVVSGTLKGGSTNQSLGGPSAVVNVADGATLDVNGQNLGQVQVYARGTGVTTNGAIVNNGADAIPALKTVHLTGDATFGAVARWDIRTTNVSALLDLAGFTMTKTNSNIVTAFNCQVTDGDIRIGQGMFRLEQTTSVTAGVGRISVQPAGTLDYWAFSGVCLRPITLNGGILSVGSGTATVGSPITLDGATNALSPSLGAALIATGLVDGAGTLLKIGAGSVKLATVEAYTGPTLVGAGALQLASTNALAGTIASSPALLLGAGGTVNVDFNDGIAGTNLMPITMSALSTLNISNGASCRLAGPFVMAGGNLSGGAPNATFGNWRLETQPIFLTNATISAPRTQLGVPAGVVFDVPANAAVNVTGALEDPGLGSTGTGTLIKTGSGVLALNGNSTYTGPTIVSNGTLKLQSAPFVVAGMAYWLDASDTNSLVVSAGKVTQWNDRSGNARNFIQTNTVLQPSFVTAAMNGMPVVRFDGVTNQMVMSLLTSPQTVFIVNKPTGYTSLNGIWGSSNQSDAGIRLANAADWRQAGGDANDFNNGTGGAVFVNGVPTNTFGGPGTAHLLSELRGAGHVKTYNNSMLGGYVAGRMWAGDIAEVLVYSNIVSAADRQLIEQYLIRKWVGTGFSVTNNVLPSGTAVWLAGGTTLDLGGASHAIGSLSDLGGAGGLVTSTGPQTGALALGNDGTTASFSGVIADGTGAVSLAMIGGGTQALHGASTFSGGTFVSNGTLLVHGALGTGGVSISAGTLGGTGVIAGSVLDLGGRVAPGASPGRLTILGDYTTIGSLDIEIAGPAAGGGYDQLVVGGGLTPMGTLNVTTNGYAPAAGDSFTIATASNGVFGTFLSANLPPLSAGDGWVLGYQTNAIVLSVTGAPPPATGYDAYALQIPNAADRAIQADPDADGYANLLEYVTGGNPTNSDQIARMGGARTNGVLALRFTRNTSATDATLFVEGGFAVTNNAAWTGIAMNSNGLWSGAATVTEGGGNPASVTVQDIVPGATNRFLRLRATRP